jgi:hypothetical protein
MGTTNHLTTTTHRTPSRVLLTLCIALSLLASQLSPFAMLPADAAEVFAGTDGLKFEIDGNFAVDKAGNSDWANRPYTTMLDSTSPHRVFTGGTKEGERGSWSVTTGNAPPKADILRLYADVEKVGSEAWLRLGAERDSGTGDTWVSFELNQENAGPTVPGTSVPVTPTVGDLLVTFQFPGNVGDAPVVRVDQWTGSGWSPISVTAYAAVNTANLTNPTGQTLEPREFLELSVDVSFLFGPDAPCRSFADSWARSRSSDSGDTSQLQDFIGPFPFGFDTCASLTLRKTDTNGAGQAGVALELYEGDEVVGEPFRSCTTGADGSCAAFTGLEPGEYTAYEVAPPVGFKLSEPERTQTFTLGPDDVETITFVNPPITYAIDVDPEDDTNAVGFTHEFVVTLTTDFLFDYATGDDESSDAPDIPLAGQTVDLTWSGPPTDSGIVDVDGTSYDKVTSASCTTAADGTCTVTVLADEVGGPGTLTASYSTPLSGPAASSSTTDGGYFSSISDSGQKSWIGYRASLEGEFHNPLGVDHTFTASVVRVNANASETVAAGVVVTFDWDGPEGSELDEDSCTTGALGTCTVTVSSPDGAGTGTLTITSIAGEIVTDEQLVIEFEGENAPSATKTWWDYRATVEADAVNPIDESHTFDVTVERTADGETWLPALDGTIVDAVWTGVGAVSDEACSTGTVDGTCTVTVSSSVKGTGTLTVTGITTTLGGYQLEDDVEQPFDFDVVDDSASKSWVDWTIDITFDAENPAGTEHVFTIDVAVWDPVTEAYVPVPDGTTLTLAYSDADLVDDDSTCTVEGTVDGTCTITASSDAAAALTVTVTAIAGTDLPGYPEGTATFDLPTTEPVTSTKTWIEYRIVGDDDAYNVVGDPHTFTLTAEQLRPDADGWEPLPGVTLDVTLETDVAATMDASDCTDTGTGEDGTCVVVVSSDVPGSASVIADGISGIVLLDGVTDTSTTSWDLSVEEAVQTKHWIQIDLVKTALLDEDAEGFKTVTYSTDPDVDPPVITYSFTITNPSSVPLTVTSLEDDVMGTITLPDPLVLAPLGGTATVLADHVVTREEADEGSIFNTADVIAESEDGTEVTARDTEEVFIVVVFASGSIDLIKTALVDRDDEGNKTFTVGSGETAVVTYRYRITNNGNVPLSDLWLLDDRIGDIPLPDDLVLAPDETFTIDADYTVTTADLAAGEVENIAIVTGFTPDGVEVTDTDDEIVFPVEVLPVVVPKPTPAPTPAPLARTGADTGLLLTLGMLMAAMGAAALLFTPRRRRDER